MNPGEAKPRRRTRWLLAIAGFCILATLVWAGWYLTSPQFHDYVQGRIVADLEDITGGRVEMKSLKWNLLRLQFEIHDLTIHGKEGPDEAPYAQVERMVGRAEVISLLRRKIGLRELELDRPRIHLIVYPDGTTNQPAPRRKFAPGGAPVFELGIRHAAVREGQLLLNDHAVPLDFTVDKMGAVLTYVPSANRYDGTVRTGRIDTQYRDLLPATSNAEAEFSLRASAAEFKSLRWSSGKSDIEASGHISDFSKPKLELTYKARLDLVEFARLARTPELRGGTLELNGQGTYTPNEFYSSGKLLVRDLDYRAPAGSVRNATLGAEYYVTRDRVSLPHTFAHVFGGTVVGDAEVRNWTAMLAPVAETASRGAPPEGTAHLKVDNLPVEAVVAMISSQALPLNRLNLAGAAGGTVDARWKGRLSNMQASILAQAVPPARVKPGQIPVSARLQAEYIAATGEVRVAHLALATRASRLTASGKLGGGAGNLKLVATSTDLGELTPLLEALYGPKQLPVELHGQVRFEGTAVGRLPALTVAGHLEASNFDTLVALAPSSGGAPSQPGAVMPATKAHRAHWDSFSADILYSPRMLAARNGILRSGEAQLNLDGSIALTRGAVVPASPISAHIIVHNGDISELQALAGYNLPLRGTLNANLALGGTEGDPRGSGRVALTSGFAYGEPIDAFAADFVFAHRELQASNINLAHDGARIIGTAAYNLATSVFRFDLRGTNVNLARVQRLQSRRSSIAGIANFTARGSGTKEAPVIDATVRMTGVVLNGERVGDFVADAVTTGGEVRITGRSNFENADLRIDGGLRPAGDFPMHLSLHFTHLDFDPLIRAFVKGRLTGHSSMAGNIEVRGPLRHPRDWDITGTIEQLSANLENTNIQNDGPIRFTMAQETFRFQQLRLVGEDTAVTAVGTIQLGNPARLDFQSEGHANLKLLHSFYPEVSAAGTLTFGLNLTGPASNPQVQGQMQIAGGSVSYVDVPNGLSDMNGVLVFNRDRLVVQTLSARTGGGTLNIGGFVTYGRTPVFNLTATGRDIRLRYPAGLSSMANADLRLTGSLQNSTLAGDIVVTKFGMTPQFDFASYVIRAKQLPEAPWPNSPLNNLHLDVHITSTPELQVQTSLAKISGDVDLHLRGVAARPLVLGRVNIIEGDIAFGGTKYHLERGDITFNNPVRIEPVLDIEATARVKEYDVTLGFHGPMDRLKTTYRSDPPLPSADIIALLALGRTREETAVQQQAQPSFTEAASYAILGQALNAAVSGRVQRIFGVGRIKIDPQATTETGTTQSGPQLSIEQQVNNNITLTYVTNLSQGNQQTIQLQYDINRNVSIIAIRDDLTGVVSFDVKIRQRRK